MLLLHGLHPDRLDKRVGAAVERLRPHLGVHGLRLEVIGIVNGVVRLRLSGGAGVRAQLLWTIPSEIENAIFEAAPDVEKVTIDGLEFPSLAASSHAME
jgi:Fe-S cluster biogenesis protein NfuA